jgi:hypothetical protein
MAAYTVIQVNHKPGVIYDRTQVTHRKTILRHPPLLAGNDFLRTFRAHHHSNFEFCDLRHRGDHPVVLD